MDTPCGSSPAFLIPPRAVEHPSVPEDPEYVRVRTYESQMVIRPHKTFDEVRFWGEKLENRVENLLGGGNCTFSGCCPER